MITKMHGLYFEYMRRGDCLTALFCLLHVCIEYSETIVSTSLCPVRCVLQKAIIIGCNLITELPVKSKKAVFLSKNTLHHRKPIELHKKDMILIVERNGHIPVPFSAHWPHLKLLQLKRKP